MDWREKITSKYPELFPKHIAISCDKGWYWLIDNLCDKLSNCIKTHSYKNDIIINITYIKEKFGVLDVFLYTENTDEKQLTEIYSYVSFATHLSTKICERCGSLENIGRTSKWIKYLCIECVNNDKNRNNWLSNTGKLSVDALQRKIKLQEINKNETS